MDLKIYQTQLVQKIELDWAELKAYTVIIFYV